MPSNIRIGSRGSELALWQTHFVKSLLEKHFPDIQIEIQIMRTTGDKILDSPLSKIGDKGIFTKELEVSLQQQRIDLAVHSLKDIPTVIPDDLTIAAVLEREDVRDVFIGHPQKSIRTFASLPRSAKIATGSLRRTCQLLHARNDLQVIGIRGNLNTRLKKLDASDWDGMILAKAGVTRLDLSSRITEILPLQIMLPAVGQGALAIETRKNDTKTQALLNILHHTPTAIAVSAERALLHRLEGGCQVPIGAYGQVHGNDLTLDAMI